MIKFDFSVSAQLQTKYETEIISKTKQRMADFISTIPTTHQSKFELFFDDAKIDELLFCEPSELQKHIHEVYTAFPVLADRYWPAFLLKGVPIPDDIEKLGARTLSEKKNLDTISNNVSKFLNSLATSDRHYISWLLTSLNKASTYGKKKKALATIQTAEQGNNRATEEFLERFPSWVNAFQSVFNYPELSTAMGHDIIDEWKIDVCLYCNQEPIQTQGKLIKHRTDLDHFHPRTKFPFLAVTLSNLIPSGKICNQGYKKNQDMINYEHPFIAGANESRIFHLDIPPGEKVTEENFKVRITKLNSKLDNNLSAFEIEHNYGNSNELKSWVSNAHGMIEIILGLNEPHVQDQMINSLVNTKKPPHNERQKKFKADSINQFANKILVQYP